MTFNDQLLNLLYLMVPIKHTATEYNLLTKIVNATKEFNNKSKQKVGLMSSYLVPTKKKLHLRA